MENRSKKKMDREYSDELKKSLDHQYELYRIKVAKMVSERESRQRINKILQKEM